MLASSQRPTSLDEAGYAYLDDLKASGQLTVQEMALVQHEFSDQQVQLGTLGQLLLQYATVGMTSGLTGAQAAMAQAAISGGVQGAVSGNFDLGKILQDVAFAGVSGAATAGFDLNDTLKLGNDSLLGMVNGKLSFASIVNSLGDSVVTAGLTTAVYGGTFGDNFQRSFTNSVINLAQADLQTLIGDRHNGANALVNGGEGSAGHVFEHALLGCLAGSALGGSCEASAAAAAVSAVYAGAVDPQQALKDQSQFIANATLLGGLGAALASGGDTNATMIASSVAGSAFENNYLRHTDVARAVERLKACAEGDTACREAVFDFLAKQSIENDMNLVAKCGGDAECMVKIMVVDADYFDPMSFAVASDIRTAFGEEYADFAGQVIEAKLHHVAPLISQAFQNIPDFAENSGFCTEPNEPNCVYQGLMRISVGADAALTIASLHPATALLSSILQCASEASPAACEAAIMAVNELTAERAKALKLAVKELVEKVVPDQAGEPDTQANMGDKGRAITEQSRGTSGDWNKDLNNPQPNKTYVLDNGDIYQTDEIGRIRTVKSELRHDPNDRNKYQQGKAGGECRLPGDCGGHLIAAVFGGAGEAINLVPMDKTLNGVGGKWYELEKQWLGALGAGKNVKVDIQPVYSGNSKRPDSFVVKYEVDGRKFEPPPIKNTPTGD